MTMQTRTAERIRQHLYSVEALRARATDSGIGPAIITIKRLQALRFAHSYRDFFDVAEYAPAVRFFLEELYGVRDFRERDLQFARIAGGLEHFFPADVAELAVNLSELHALTETLDFGMALAWMSSSGATSEAARYGGAWLSTGSRQERIHQLSVVLHMGAELERLTHKKSLRMALRLMRSPAKAAGLEALQTFLESGFEAFGAMRSPSTLMKAIEERESRWIRILFDDGDVAITELERAWS